MEDFLWVEKYRPKTIGECVLPSGLKHTLSEFISKGDLPNMILSGGPGVGKTTAAKAMLDQLGLTYMFINGSEIDFEQTMVKTGFVFNNPLASRSCSCGESFTL